MVIARTPVAREALMQAFAAHTIERAYLAIALGDPPSAARWDTLHGRHPRDRKRFSTRVVRGKRAVTHVEVVERLHGAALVRCRLETGRTHQIRVHLADHGYPLLGDPIYGARPKDPRLRAAADALDRQALHAAVLGFAHPVTGAPLRFETPPPEDLGRAIEALRQSTNEGRS
jgi:23S rRNA pseudouridine1911/1915/1917 synthase